MWFSNNPVGSCIPPWQGLNYGLNFQRCRLNRVSKLKPALYTVKWSFVHLCADLSGSVQDLGHRGQIPVFENGELCKVYNQIAFCLQLY